MSATRMPSWSAGHGLRDRRSRRECAARENVIVMIADGWCFNHRSGRLLPVWREGHAGVRTRVHAVPDVHVPRQCAFTPAQADGFHYLKKAHDSAAAATTMFGVKTLNVYIGMGPDNNPSSTQSKCGEERTGVVTTVQGYATPAVRSMTAAVESGAMQIKC